MVGAILGGAASLFGGFLGSQAAKKAKKAGVKAGKKQQALSQNLVYGTPASGIPGTPGYRPAVAGTEAQYGTDIATQNRVLADQQGATAAQRAETNRLLQQGRGDITGALTTGRADVNNLLQQGRGDLGVWSPYTQAGTEALAAQQGQYGGPNAARYIQNFKESPDYLLNYEAAINRGEEGLGANFSPGGGLNSGAIRKALQTNAVNVTNPFINQYGDRIQQGVETGLKGAEGYSTAAGNLTNLGINAARDFTGIGANAAGNLAGIGVNAAGQLGAGQRADLGAYGSNTMQLGANRLAGYGQGLAGQGAALGNIATAKAAGATGSAAAWNSGIQNAISAVNNAEPWSSIFGGGGSTASNPYSGYMPWTSTAAQSTPYPGLPGR